MVKKEKRKREDWILCWKKMVEFNMSLEKKIHPVDMKEKKKEKRNQVWKWKKIKETAKKKKDVLSCSLNY